MLKRALVCAACGIGLESMIAIVLPLVRSFLRYPASWGFGLNLLTAAILGLFPAVALILFLLALHREVSGKSSVEVRQRYAMVAVIGQAVLLVLALMQVGLALAMAPDVRAISPPQNSALLVLFQVVPLIGWIGLLRIFWKERTPSDSKRMQLLAAVLCLFTLLTGIYRAYRMATRISREVAASGWNLWDVGIGPAVSILSWVSLAFVLFALYRHAEDTAGQGPLPEKL